MRRVYRFGLQPPVDGAAIVREQLRALLEYRNDLVAIERGRRWALRQVDDTPAVRAAVAALVASTKSTRKAALQAVRDARKEARDASADELARITALDESIRRDARALTPLFWGSYLEVEAAHQQVRATPLYDEDGHTPKDPRFAFPRSDGKVKGQLGIQIQSTKPMTTADAWRAEDTRARLEPAQAYASEFDKQGRPRSTRHGRKATLALRVGSEGRAPVWARWPIWVHREVPHAAQWKWVRVSLRLQGPYERWSCEITVDDPAPPARTLDATLAGAVAVEWCWEPLPGDALRVARWADTLGRTGDVVLDGRVCRRLRKASDLRAVRDVLAENARPKIARLVDEAKGVPPWLAREAHSLPLWKSLTRMHGLLARWPVGVAPAARALLEAWVRPANPVRHGGGDLHLWSYETGCRNGALGVRKNFYRRLAREWSGRYRRVLLSDQDLARAARWGDEGELRFRAGCSELAGALRNAFGDEDAIAASWRDQPAEDDSRSWCECTRDAWMAGGARGDGRFAERKEKTSNAWAKRKEAKAAKALEKASAREPLGKSPKS